MKKIILFIQAIIITFLLGLSATLSLAANTITVSPGGIITISSIDSDWTWSDTFPTGTDSVEIFSIQFNPGAAGDQCVILDTNASGSELFDVSATDVYDQKEKIYPRIRMKPFLDYSAGTYSAGAKVIIVPWVR